MMKNYMKMKTRIALAMAFCVMSFAGMAQLAMTRSTFTGAYTAIVGGTTSTATGDDAYQQNIPLGFTFNYLGTNYTQFSVSTNGWISFANGATYDAASVDLYNTTTGGVVAPWWDDLSSSAIVYQTSGTAGSQVCTIQWTSLSYYTTSTRTINYQVKLYEGTNVIEFCYGAMPTGVVYTSESASIGIKSITGGNGQYLDAVTGSAFTGNTTLQSDRWPSYNFRFTPGAPTALAAGTYNVGVGQTYRNLNEAAAEVNHRGVAGAVVFNLTDAQYDATAANGGNFFPVLFGPIAGVSAGNTVTVTKTGTAAIVSYGGATGTVGSIANQASATALGSNVDPVIGLVGADYVTLNNLDIRGNVGNLLADHGIAMYNSSATDGSTNNVVSNVTVTMSRPNTGSRGFLMNVITTPTSAAGANSNNTFKDFTIKNVYAGIQCIGNGTFPDLNTQITRTVCGTFNSIGDPATTNDIGNGGSSTYGIRMTNQSGFTVTGNNIRNVSGSAVQTDGIFIETFQGVASVNNNKIQTVRNTSTSSTTGIAGIRASHATTGTHTLRIYNNSVSEITSAYTGTGSTARTLKGILISGTGGSTSQVYEIYNNNVSIDGSGSPNLSSVCFEVNTTSGPVFTLANNIFANFTAAQGATARHYTMVSTSATVLGNTGTTSNNNDLFIANDAGTSGFIGRGNATDYATLANWQAAMTGLDAASVSITPSFVSNTADLHAGNLSLNGGGLAPPAYVASDLDCAARTPDNDLGAYIVTACSGLPTAGTITGTAAVCSGLGTTLTLTGASSGAGITYQWASSTTPGGPYTTLLGTSNTQATGALTSTTYYVVGVGCTVSGMAAATTEFTVAVNALPVVAVTPSTGSICIPGAVAVALTASNASTYTWLPATGLSGTTGANVNALPAAATTYTVSGTDGNGCIGTATAVIGVNERPSISSLTAVPSSVCSGGNSQLQATAGLTTAYTNGSIPFAAIPTPGAGVTTLANTGTATTPLDGATTLDDGYWMNRSIPFSFVFYGTTYTSFAVSTNGFIWLGTGAPNTYTNYNTVMPSAAMGHPCIGANYADLDWRTSGTINYFTNGTAPNRQLVINYAGGQFYNGVGNINTQIIIYETSNVIEVHTTASTGNNPTVEGIQNAAGTTASVVTGRNNTLFTVTVPEAYRWTPSGTGTLTYSWTPATFLSSTTINNPMANAITASTTYTVSVMNNGCASTGSVAITAGSALSSTSNVSSGSVCTGTTVTFNSIPAGGGAPYTYAWSGPNGFTSTVQNPTLATTVAATGTYSITVTDACAATSMTTVNLTVNALPTVSVTPSTGLYCNPGTAVALAASGTSTSYAWLPATGLSATTGANVNASPSATTTYTVTGTDGNGCVSSATAMITSAEAVTTAAASSSAAATCIGSTVDLMSSAAPFTASILTENFNSGAATWTRGNASTGGTPANAAWTDRPNGYVYAGGTAYHSNDNTTFVQTNSDAQGSGSTASTTLMSPSFSTSGLTGIKVNFFHYYRDIADAGDSAVVEASTNGTAWTIANVYSTNQGSEAAFASASVNLPPAFDNQATVYVRFRYKGTWDWYWSIDNVTITGGSTAFTYSWNSTPAGFTSSTQNPTGVGPTVNTVYDVLITNPAGCSATASTAVVVNSLPTVTAMAMPATVCAGDQTTLMGMGATSYTWTGGATDNVAFAPAATDTYTVTGTDANGCTNTTTQTVTVNALPTVTASADNAAICEGGNVTLTGGGATAPYTWSGSVTDGVAFSPLTTDTYTVTGTDGNGCSNTATVTVTVNTLPTVTASADNAAICTGSNVTLTGGGATSYTWTGSVTDGVAFAPTATDTYTVTGTDANGCMNTATVTVTVNTLPTVTASADNTTICAGSNVTLTGGGATSYTWTGGATDGVAFAPSATDTYTVTGTDASGCMNTATVMVTVNTLPTVTASADNDSICAGSNVTLTGGGATSYTWTGGAADGVAFAPSTTDTYTVTGTDASGCMNTAMVTVTVNALPSVAMTPFTVSVCDNQSAFTLTNGSPTGGVYSGTAITADMFDPTVAGAGMHVIIYTVTDATTMCSNSDTATITVDLCSGIAAATQDGMINVYPNPASGMVTVSISNANYTEVMISIVDVQGKVVYQSNEKDVTSSYNKSINIESFAKGVYYIKLNTGNGTKVQKLIVQ